MPKGDQELREEQSKNDSADNDGLQFDFEFDPETTSPTTREEEDARDVAVLGFKLKIPHDFLVRSPTSIEGENLEVDPETRSPIVQEKVNSETTSSTTREEEDARDVAVLGFKLKIPHDFLARSPTPIEGENLAVDPLQILGLSLGSSPLWGHYLNYIKSKTGSVPSSRGEALSEQVDSVKIKHLAPNKQTKNGF